MFSTMKRRLGVITAIAVMAALVPALSTSSAGAAVMTTAANGADPATYSACPASASIPSAGMTDTTSTDVDCIAYYGITTGVTATTYEPTASVPRWQMALYLTRTASKAGHTLGSGADQGFTDISGYAADIQTAINQLKQLGVTTGTTATTYSPDDNVTREQMSMFLDRLLGITAAGPGGVATNASNPLNVDRAAADLYNYTDIDTGSVTFEGHNSIEELYNLRVYGDDKTVTTFSPAASITRADMATWLTNALGHTNVRPAGINIQMSAYSGFANSAPTAEVSYRDANHVPVSGQVIDMFQWRTSTTPGNTSPWTAAGACSSNVAILGNSLTKCTIDIGDPSTNASGNLSVGAVAQTATKTENIYAWTAAAGTAYDNDVHTNTSVSATTTSTAASILVTCSGVDATAQRSTTGGAGLANATAVHHGDSITLNMQMATTGNGGFTYTAIPQPLNKITVTHSIYQPGSNAANGLASVTSTTLYSDAAGQASYTFTQADPNLLGATAAATDDVLHSILVGDGLTSASAEIGGAQNVTSGLANPCATNTTAVNVEATPFVWDFRDEISDEPVTATLTVNVADYKAGSATAPVSRSATLTKTDKYGDALASVGTVVFHGGGEDALDARAVAGGAGTVADSFETASNLAATWPVGTAVCFSTLRGGTLAVDDSTGALAAGTVYYVKTVTAADPSVMTIARTAGGATISLAGTPAVTNKLALAHPTAGCGARSVGPAGTASLAWNDTTATAGIDTISATTNVDTVINDNADGVDGDTTKTKSAYRWLAPSDTALSAANTNTTNTWTTVDANTDGDPDADGDVTGTPVIVDAAGSRMVVAIAFDDDTAITDTTFTSYTWDSNDFFFLNSVKGVTTTPTTAAGFLGTYTTGVSGSKGLLNHQVDAGGAGTSYTEGDLDAVTYKAASGSTSVFKLGD